MRLYLVRHGEALSEVEDPARPLSKVGRDQTRRVAEALGRAGVRVAEIHHSGKARAAQTAEILAKHLSSAEPKAMPGLAPNDPVLPVAEELARRGEDLMLVGHLPFLALLAALLLTGNPRGADLRLDPASVACLERDAEGSWSLLWLAGPSIFF